MRQEEIVECICPGCGRIVKLRLNLGVVSDPEYTLIADWVYHSECWEKQIEKFPMG